MAGNKMRKTSAQTVSKAVAPAKARVTLHVGPKPKKSLLEELDEMEVSSDDDSKRGTDEDSEDIDDDEDEDEDEEKERTVDEDTEESEDEVPSVLTPKSLKRKRTKAIEGKSSNLQIPSN
jgi:Ran GTPase-activating protein (RanGAP) involved in mRNA processing and transport